MPFGTNAGAPEQRTFKSVYLNLASTEGRGQFLVHVVAEAPMEYKPAIAPVKTAPSKVLGNSSIKVVMGCAEGFIDYDMPLLAPPDTKWTQESVDANLNMLAECTGVVPNATKTGIPSKQYTTEGAFLRDILLRGGWFWINVYKQKGNDGKEYTRFGSFEGASPVAGDDWGDDSAKAVDDELPF